MLSIHTRHQRSSYQDKCQAMVAPAGVNRKPAKIKGVHKKGCTKPSNNPLTGTLARRLKRLGERRHGMQGLKLEEGYRIPGSMTK